jgi:type IV pilus assembly protein PilB
MGIEPVLVASAIDCVVAQRLARTLCTHCKRPTTIGAAVLRESGYTSVTDIAAYEPVGCSRCAGTGYRGRIGLYEVMPVTAAIRSLALERRPAAEIAAAAVAEGMRSMRDDGLEKVKSGRISITEVTRVVGSR